MPEGVTTWPASLQQAFNAEGASFRPAGNAVFSDVESGEPLARMRFTGKQADIVGTIPCDYDQGIDLLEFFEDELEEGTLPFTWRHPVTDAEVQFRFLDAPTWNGWPGFGWRVDLRLRKLAD